MTVVLTCGTWDLPHHGHWRLMRRARACGDTLVVGVHDGSHHKRPLMTLAERIATITATGIADHVVGYGDPLEIVERLRPDLIVQGDDWHSTGPARARIAELAEVLLVPRTPGISTSDLRARLLLEAPVIRRATIEDLEPINGLMRVAFGGGNARPGDLDDPHHIVLVHATGGHVDGVVAANLVRTLGRWNAYTSRLAVDPAARGQGIATELMRAITDELDRFAREVNQEILVLGTIRADRTASRLAHVRAGWQRYAAADQPGWDLFGRFVGIEWPSDEP